MTHTPLIIAIPSKGRLQENTNAFFARLGFEVLRGRGIRDYRGTLKGLNQVEIAFLSASEITDELAKGNVHLGITGEDLIREQMSAPDDHIVFLAPLGFGYANVVVAVPEAWIDVRSMTDLEDVAALYRAKRGERMRVATKYITLTRRYFQQKGVADYRIVESLGATEGAPAAGQAELIVDITTTGATLQANALKILQDGVILNSQAYLVASLKRHWDEGQLALVKTLLARMTAEEKAKHHARLSVEHPAPAPTLLQEAAQRFEARSPFQSENSANLDLICPAAIAPDLAGWLLTQGAKTIAVQPMSFLFEAHNERFERLIARLRG